MMHRNRHVFDIRLLELTPQQQKRLMLIGFVILFVLLWAPVARAHGFWVAATRCAWALGGGAAAGVGIGYISDGVAAYIRGGTFPRGRAWDYQSIRRKSPRRCVNCNCALSAVKKDKISDDEADDETDNETDKETDNETDKEADNETDNEENKWDREEKSRFPQRTSTPPMLEHLPLAYEAEVVGDSGGGDGGGDGGDAGGDNNYRMWNSTRGWTGHVWSALYGPPDMVSRQAKARVEKWGAK